MHFNQLYSSSCKWPPKLFGRTNLHMHEVNDSLQILMLLVLSLPSINRDESKCLQLRFSVYIHFVLTPFVSCECFPCDLLFRFLTGHYHPQFLKLSKMLGTIYNQSDFFYKKLHEGRWKLEQRWITLVEGGKFSPVSSLWKVHYQTHRYQ